MKRSLTLKAWEDCDAIESDLCDLECGAKTETCIFEKVNRIKALIDIIATADWSRYDSVSIRGGEVFGPVNPCYGVPFLKIIDKLNTLLEEGKIQRIYFYSCLKYQYQTSNLYRVLDYFLRLNKDCFSKIIVSTRWDKNYRFYASTKSDWKTNVSILQRMGIGVHIHTYYSEPFIQGYRKKDPEILALLEPGVDKTFCLQPCYGMSRGLVSKNFYPKKYHYIDGLELMAKENRPLFESFIKNLIEKEIGQSMKGKRPCGHSVNLSVYKDSEDCTICDTLEVYRKVMA